MVFMLGQWKFITRTVYFSLKYFLEHKVVSILKQRWLCKLLSYDSVINYKRWKEWTTQLQIVCQVGWKKRYTNTVIHWDMDDFEGKAMNAQGPLTKINKIEGFIS